MLSASLRWLHTARCGLLSQTACLFGGYTGKVKQYDPTRNFGFIIDDESFSSYFVHRDGLVFGNSAETNRCLAPGQRVTFDLVRDQRKDNLRVRCVNVCDVSGEGLPPGPTRTGSSGSNSPRAADAASMIGQRDLVGIVARFDNGFGFIVGRDDNIKALGNLFVHAADLSEGATTLRAGDVVMFDIAEDSRRPGRARCASVRVVSSDGGGAGF